MINCEAASQWLHVLLVDQQLIVSWQRRRKPGKPQDDISLHPRGLNRFKASDAEMSAWRAAVEKFREKMVPNLKEEILPKYKKTQEGKEGAGITFEFN